MPEQESTRRWADAGDDRRKAIFDSAVEFAIIATDTSGRITDWNAGAAQILGWSAGEMLGVPADRFFTPEDVANGQVSREMRLSLERGRAMDERWHLRKDGSRFWASGEMMPLRAPDGMHLGFLKILRDRTAQHVASVAQVARQDEERQEHERGRARQAEALRDSEDFARLAMSAVGGVGVWTYELATDLFFCDAAISRLYGLDPLRGAAGILRAEFLANVHPDDLAALRATMSGGTTQPGDLELEYRIQHADGSVNWVLSRGHTYFDDAGKAVRRTGIGVDMTRQRVLEEQLRQSQKLEAVGQLTGGIAHDFNNSLSTISTSIELLKRRLGTGTPDELARYLAMAMKAVRGAAALTQRLLTFSRKQTLDIRAVDVNRQAIEMEDLLRRTLGEKISLRLELAPDLWPANTDAHQLEQSLVNLAINARDAMPAGGSLTIRTSNAAHDDGAAAAPYFVSIQVADTGTGMTPDVIRRAFDPFFTTKPIGQGTGLGLSMIHGFANQSGGRVEIESAPGVGTTVRILLPRASGAAEQPVRHAVPDQVPQGTGERILVVEDEPDVRAMLLEVLTQHGYETSSATSAAAALELLEAGARFSLLLSDIGLPSIDGRELAARARVLRPDLPVLFLTGYAGDAAIRSEYLDDGMDLLTKPFDVDELAHRIFRMTRSAPRDVAPR